MESKSLVGKVALGTEVTITAAKFQGKKAKVLYIGLLDSSAPGEWVGLQLIGDKGNHSGNHNGKSYFTTSVPDTGIFARPKDLILPNGKKMDELIQESNSSQPGTGTKTGPVKKDAKTEDKPPTKTITKTTGVVGKGTEKQAPSKVQAPSQQRQNLKTQLDNSHSELIQKQEQKIMELQKEIRQLKDVPVSKIKQENQSLIAKLKEVEQQNHNMKMQKQRMEHQVQPQRETKLGELNDEIAFYKKYKDDTEKQKKKLETRISQLEEELDQHSQNEDLILKLNSKVQHLETKNQGLKLELQTTKTQLKNSQSVGGGGEAKSQSAYNEEISILNQTVTLLESQSKQDKQKLALMQKQIETNSAKLSQFAAIQKKLKQRERQVAQLKQSLDEQVDAINFVEQLSLTKLRIQQQLKASKQKIQQLLNEKDLMEQVQLQQEDISRELEHETNERDILIQQLHKQLKDKDNIINEKLNKIEQYKDKISQLLRLADQNKNLAQMRAARQAVQNEAAVVENPQMRNNTQFMDMIKFAQSINHKYLKLQNDSILVRNKAGVFLLNLLQALPNEFIQQFYPQAVDILVTIKTSKDKVFYLFEWICTELREKNDLYSDENTNLTNWILSLMNKLQQTYYNLLRVDLLISNCENQQELGNIITHRGIKDQSIAIDAEISGLIQRFMDNSVSANLTFQVLDHSNAQIESECAGFNKNMTKDNQTKLELCKTLMDSLSYAFTLVLSFRVISELRQNSEIDMAFDNCLKKLIEYLRELCLNNHIRYKPKMNNLIDDMKILKDSMKEIEGDDRALLDIQNLAGSQHQVIKIFKDTISSTLSYVKELIADLSEIQLSDELQKIQNKLDGSVWSAKLVEMKEQLLKVRILAQQKAALEFELKQAKLKIILQEKDIQNKNVVKDVLEKRIAELQLKAEEVTVLKNTIQRLEAKVKSQSEDHKVMEEQIQNLIKKKLSIDEENKKLKETIAEHAPRHNRASIRQMANVSSYSFNSVPLQSLLKENSNLRNADLKQKVSAIKFSEVMKLRKDGPLDQKKPIRRRILETMVNMKVVSPFDRSSYNGQLELQKLYLELDKVSDEAVAHKNVKLIEVGTVRVWGGMNQAAGNTISVLGYSQLRNILPDLIKS